MLGNRLRQIREEHELSQQDLAKKIGKSQKTISSWEKGRTTPRLSQLNELCKIYDCTYEHLTGVRQYNANDITLEDIFYRLPSLEFEDLEKLEHQVKGMINLRIEMRKVELEKQDLMAKLQRLEAYQNKMQNKPQ